MIRKFSAALLALVVAACGGDGITSPSERDALLREPAVLALGVDSLTGASIETNKDDYSPGEVVHVVGRGWAPGETVNLHMTEEPNTHADVDTNVVADSSGGFSVHYYDVQPHDYGVEFTLTATGITSGSIATATFTDGRIVSSATIEGSAAPISVNATVNQSLAFVVGGATVSGGGNARWMSTQVLFTPNPTGTLTTRCDDFDVQPVNTPTTGLSRSFSANAPSVAGTYRVTFIAYQDDGCVTQPSAAFPGAAGPHFTVIVASLVSTSTTLAANPTSTVFGESVTFTATVTPTSGPAAQGTVSFYKKSVSGETCSALGGATLLGSDNTHADGFTHATSALAVGAHEILACYAPAAGWSASGGSTSHTVDKANTSTTIASDNPDPSSVGETVAFVVNVAAASPGAGTPGGTVTLYEFTGGQSCTTLSGAAAIGSGSLTSGSVTINVSSLPFGTHTVTACYGGDANFNGSSDTEDHNVALVGTTTDITSSINPSVTGQSTTFTATVTRTVGGAAVTTGTIAFKTGGSDCSSATTTLASSAPDGSGQATHAASFLASQSTVVVRACYTEGTTYASSEDAVTQTINKAATSISPSDTPDPTVFGQSVTLNASVSVTSPGQGTPTGSVTFYILDPGASCTVPGASQQLGTTQSLPSPVSTSTTAIPVGTNQDITACYSGDADFLGSTNTTQHTVNKAQTTLTLTTNGPQFFGLTSTFTATISVNAPGAGTPTGTVNFAIGGTCQADGTITGGTSLGAGSTSVAISSGQAQFSTTALNANPYSIVGCYGGDGNFLGDGDTKSHTVNPAVTKTVASSTPDPSTFGQQVTFSATVSIDAGQGAGTPTGSVTFRLGGTDCSTGTSLGSDAVDGSGVASIDVTSGSLNVTLSPHTIRACFDNTDGNFSDSNGTDSHTVNAAATTVTASVQTTTPQYSDEATLRAAITPLTVLSSTQAGTVHFYVGSGAVTCGATPPAGSVGSDPLDGSGVAEIDYQVLSAAGSHTVTACFYSSNANFAHGSDTETITVTTEDATVTPDAGNINSIPSGSGGTPVSSFQLKFVVKETNPEPDQNAGALAGDLNNLSFTAVLNAVGSGANNETGTCVAGSVVGTGYSATRTYTCTFTSVAVDAYEVVATVNGSYYDGNTSDALSVYDPNAGFVTGGGKFVFPGSTDRVNFGLVFSNPSKKAIRGNIVVIRHMANGDICRAKSNALEAPAIVQNAASFAGKGNYNCTRPDGTQYDGGGNLTMTGWVQDNGQGSTATGPDKFWFKVSGALNNNLVMPGTAPTGAASLTGGNIQVPQPGGR